MLSLPEALSIVLSHSNPFGATRVPLAFAWRGYLAEPLVASFDNPRFDNSAVDGFAVRTEDCLTVPAKLAVVGESSAGHASPPPLVTGQAVRIFTGAPIPGGADAVVMQEDCEWTEDAVTVKAAPPKGQHVRACAEEYASGAVLLPAHTCLTPPAIGLVAMQGHEEVAIFRRPKVATLTTGTELAKPGEDLKPGQIYDSNSAMLSSAVLGRVLSVSTNSVGDDPVDTEAAIADALASNDVLITSGGVSVGDHDHVKSALAELDVEQLVWQISIKPGKPFYFGKQKGTGKLVFGLPGNPVSAVVCLHLLVLPALAKMSGGTGAENVFEAVLGSAVEADPKRTTFARARLSAEKAQLTAHPVEGQGSHMLAGLAEADALLEIPPGSALKAGDLVSGRRLVW